MTNYDRWKLATPNYLEDEDDRAISGVHSEIFDGEGGHDIHPCLRCNSQDAGQELDYRHTKKLTSLGRLTPRDTGCSWIQLSF